MVSLEAFVEARLAEEQPVAEGRARVEFNAKREVLAAYRRARFGSTHRAGVGIALKAIARIWDDHDDFDPAWRT